MGYRYNNFAYIETGYWCDNFCISNLSISFIFPMTGDWYANPDLLVPTVADKVNLAPAYEVVCRGGRVTVGEWRMEGRGLCERVGRLELVL